jgi:hypothetical protein
MVRAVSIALLGTVGCSDSRPSGLEDEDPLWELSECSLTPTYLQDGGIGFDGLPALANPDFTGSEPSAANSYVDGTDRVIGIVVGGQPLAVPLAALWYHEIVNLDRDGRDLVITHGTFTGSSRAFHRTEAGGSDFGVTGYLYQNNVLIYDRTDEPSAWAQMTGEAHCGPRLGARLSPYPFLEVTWDGWKSLYPNTQVLSFLPSPGAEWGTYPYGDYETTGTFFFPAAMPDLDPRRPSKERVLGVPDATVHGGLAFPFGALQALGPVAVAQDQVDGKGLVVFWRTDLEGASAFWREVNAQELTFSVQDGEVVDEETGTTWDFLGVGSGGGSDGERLQPVVEATVAYWGAWAAFYPDTDVWEGS